MKMIKRYKVYISAKRISEGLSGTGFWAEIKQIFGHQNTLPKILDGFEDSSKIADTFQEQNRSSNNCVSFDPHQMAALLEETNLDIDNMVGCCSASFIIDDIN